MTPEAIWQGLPVPVIVLDAQERVLDVTPSAEGFLNLSRRALLGKRVAEILSLDAQLARALSRAGAQGTELRVRGLRVGSGGSCDLCLAPMPSDPGRMIITLSPQDSGPATGGEGPDRAARSAIGMAEMLAHEIKNPLAGITGAAQLLSMSLGAEDRALTDLIVAECQRVVGLLDQVEAFGNQLPARRRAVNLHDTLTRARQSAEVGFAAHMRLIEEYDPSLPEAEVDPDQLAQVLLNLLKNASEANPSGGTIWLHSFYDRSVRRRDAEGREEILPLQIEIIDDGPGVPSDLAEHIFDPFVSGRENGTGLGLALVSKLMRDNGALVRIKEQERGTCFCLSLPRARLKQGD